MQGAEQFAPVAYKLVSTAKATSAKVIDDDKKQVESSSLLIYVLGPRLPLQ